MDTSHALRILQRSHGPGCRRSLTGGLLITTPLTGYDDKVYAVASGPISINGGEFAGKAVSVVKNHPTTGRIPGGAVVEAEVASTIFENGRFELQLRNPNFETARRIASKINSIVPQSASIDDPATVSVRIPYGQFESLLN